jgi:hypothetical protein
MGSTDWLSIGGWAFEIFTAVLSIVDVLSDVLVAQQFYSDGHMGWFWMVMASLFVSNAIYAGLAIGMIVQDRYKCLNVTPNTPREKWRLAGVYLLCFPLAQFFPLAQWYLEIYDNHLQPWLYPSKVKNDADALPGDAVFEREDSWEGTATTAAARDDLSADEEARRLVHRLQKSMQKHVKANVGFYVETVVEAIPQAVIQLIAVTALGQATTLQLLSMCLSLFSIVSKAYIVSVSFDLRAMLFKASLVAFDVFSMFYLFATVLAMDETVETTVWMLLPSGLGLGGESAVASGVMGLRWVPLQVSWLAAAWLHKNFYMMIAAVLTMLGFGVFVLYEEIIVHSRRVEWLNSMFMIALAAVAFFPAVLAFEGAKFAFALPLVLAVLPRSECMPFYALTFSFYRRGLAKGRVEGTSRLHHLLHYVIDASQSKYREQQHGSTHLSTRHARRNALRQTQNDWTEYMATALHKIVESDRLQIWQYRRPVMDNLTPAPKETWRQMFARFWAEFKASKKMKVFGTALVFAWLFHLYLLAMYSVLFNLAFPFVHVLRYGVFHLNVLQVTCLLFAGAALTTLIVLTPFMYRFITFTFLVKEFCDAFGWDMGPKEAKQASECVAEYHKPPHVAVLKAAIGIEVLPYDVAEGFVAPFVTIDDFDLRNMSAEECAALKDRAK